MTPLNKWFAAASCALLLSACSGEVAGEGPAPQTPSPSDSSLAASPRPTPSPSPDASTVAREVGANELGDIPVIMYHRITDDPGEFDRTPAAFRAELRRLFREGYRPIRTIDLVTGDIDVPAGTTPVVLTFDDSSPSQFAYRKGRTIDENTAVGILLDFARRHAGFDPVASMYVNERPFAMDEWQRALRELHDLGFELGNHTLSHANLAALDAQSVQRELALGAALISRNVPGARARTLALPLGIKPEANHPLDTGSWRGIRYRNLGVLLVGAGPAPSPFARAFDPLAIPRIRSAGQPKGGEPNYSSEYWLDFFKRHPERRFVSDGNPETIAFPKGSAGELIRGSRTKAVRY